MELVKAEKTCGKSGGVCSSRIYRSQVGSESIGFDQVPIGRHGSTPRLRSRAEAFWLSVLLYHELMLLCRCKTKMAFFDTVSKRRFCGPPLVNGKGGGNANFV